MKKTLLFLTVFSMFFYGTVLVSEQAMTQYEEVEVGVLPESYGASSESCGVMGGNLDLPGWTPVSDLRTCAPIEDTPPTRGPAQPINRGSSAASSSCIGNNVRYVNNGCGYRYVNNGCYRYNSCNTYYQRPIFRGHYRHWNYRCGQPVRNVVRFFHNRRPVRRAIGWVFGCRR